MENDIKELFDDVGQPNIFERVYFWFYRTFGFLFRIRTYKFIYQKLTKGFSDQDLWGLSSHISELIYPRIKAFRKMKKMSVPFFEDDQWTDEGFPLPREDGIDPMKRWNEILDNIVFAFRYDLYEENLLSKKDREDFEKKYGIPYDYDIFALNEEVFNKLQEKYKEGMRLFAVYYNDLWD